MKQKGVSSKKLRDLVYKTVHAYNQSNNILYHKKGHTIQDGRQEHRKCLMLPGIPKGFMTIQGGSQLNLQILQSKGHELYPKLYLLFL